MSYSLVVIDMQSAFSASRDARTIAHCKEQIKQAMKKGAAIIYVEYTHAGATRPCLTRLSQDYQRKVTVMKNTNDGGKKVKQAILENRFPKSRIKVRGVNTAACVLATVKGLTRNLRSANVHVIGKACNGVTLGSHQAGLKQLGSMKRVKVS